MLPESQGGALHIDVPADLASLDGVRTRVVATARGWGLPDVEALAVVTSEVVTNAIVHAGTPSHLTCRLLAPDEVEVAVTDQGAGTPRVRPFDLDALGGRGLRIVDALSTAWGVRASPAGTTVWARVRSG